MKRIIAICCLVLLAVPAFSQEEQTERTVRMFGMNMPVSRYKESLNAYMLAMGADTSGFRPSAWGDQGNGTYVNPILNADYSDPDVIRVGSRYYMVASDFHFLGMQLLESEDLVNWRLVTQLYNRFNYPGWDTNEQYSNGSWAPSIRYHNGRFYVYFCTPREGLFMTSAEKPEGPWSPLLLVHEGAGWEDPCPFWDEDGQAYLGHSLVGAGPIIIHRMSEDGTRLLDEGVEVYRGPVAEGTKIHKKDGWYYFSIPEGGVGQGNQVVLRSASLYGPFDKKVVLERGSTRINGPHQGALVDTPDGKWYFLHFQQTPILGRVVHLQPVIWADGEWPIVGVDLDRNGIGEPVYCWEMPGGVSNPSLPAASDDFSSPVLGPQWQFNHNPVESAWSLTRRKGFLALNALQADDFRHARNTLTQKLMGYSGTLTAWLDLSGLQDGQRCGLALMGLTDYLLGVRQENGRRILYMDGPEGEDLVSARLKGNKVQLRCTFDVRDGRFQFAYSTDGKRFIPFGEPFVAVFGNWKGARPGLFCYNTKQQSGTLLVDRFEVGVDIGL